MMKDFPHKCKEDGCESILLGRQELFCPTHRKEREAHNKQNWDLKNRPTIPGNIIGETMYCKFCEKPLIRKTGSQKYHDECKEPAARAIELAYRATRKAYSPHSVGQGIACLKSRKGQAGIDARIELLFCASQKEGYDPKHPERTLGKMLELATEP